MNYPDFLKAPEDVLKWIASREIDPRLSQINSFVLDFPINMYEYFGTERYSICLYPDLADYCLDLLEKEDTNKEDIYTFTKVMYKDIVQNDMWGFIYDW